MQRHAHRHGLATVEFVMVLPVMMLFAVLILKCGELTMSKARANIEARAGVYRATPGPESGMPDRSSYVTALKVTAGTHGLTEVSLSKPVSLRPVLPQRPTLTGRVAVLSGTWDHKGIAFSEPDPSFVDQRALRAATPNALAPAWEALNKLFGTASLPQLSGAMKVLDPIFSLLQQSGIEQALAKIQSGLRIVTGALDAVKSVTDGIGGAIGGILGEGAGKAVGNVLGGIANAALGPLVGKIKGMVEDANAVLRLIRRVIRWNDDRLTNDF